jgi:hypothetical protein
VRAALVRESGPPLQSSTISSGRGLPWVWWAARAAAYQPAQERIIRFVFPHPDAPMMTWWRFIAV